MPKKAEVHFVICCMIRSDELYCLRYPSERGQCIKDGNVCPYLRITASRFTKTKDKDEWLRQTASK